MKILNVSSGAVGAYFCGRLAQKGADVAVTVRSDRELIAAEGFAIKSIAGDFVFKPGAVLSSAAEYQESADYLVLTSKVLPDADMVELVRPAVKPNTVIVLIQNGIGIEDALARAFPENEILSAIAYIGVSRIAPGKLEHKGAGKLIIGKFGGGESSACKALCEMFEAAGVSAEYTLDIAFYRWKKLLWNIPFNSISVVGGGLLTGEMTNRGLLENICRNIMREIIAVAASQGITLEDELVEQNIDYTRSFTPYATSMLADFRRNRPLEVEAIVGNVYRIAAENNITIPHIATLYALLASVDKKKQESINL